MSRLAVIYDCEFLTFPGAPGRLWCGPDDPDPVVAQIGAVKLSLDDNADLLAHLRVVAARRMCPGSAKN